MIMAWNSHICWLLHLETLLDDEIAWLGNSGVVTQERGLLGQISDEKLQKQATKKRSLSAEHPVPHEYDVLLCCCVTCALALGKLRLMWPSDQAMFGAILRLPDPMARMYLTGSHLDRLNWPCLHKTFVLDWPAEADFLFFFFWTCWELTAAVDVHWAFGSLSASEIWAHGIQHQWGFVLAGESPVIPSAVLCASCVRRPTHWHLTVCIYSPKCSISSRRWGGYCCFTKWTKIAEGFCSQKSEKHDRASFLENCVFL